LKCARRPCKLGRTSVDDKPSDPVSPARGRTVVAAGLLLAALALVVLYTGRQAFFSPVALVVVAAIGMAALLLQLWLRPGLSTARSSSSSSRGALLLNLAGVVFAAGAVFADVLRLRSSFMLLAALAAILSFAIGGFLVIADLRKRTP